MCPNRERLQGVGDFRTRDARSSSKLPANKNDSCGWSFLVITRVFLLDKDTRALKRMNLTPVHFFKKRSPKGVARLCRLVSATLGLVLLTAVPALAEPVTVNQVIQTLSSSQGTLELRLNTVLAQDPATTKTGTQQNGPRAEGTQPQGGPKTESIVSGVAITSEGQQLGVDYVEEGEVEGTICDCGEILVAGGAFPKWPFLFLGAVPLVFINHCDDCDEERSESPTPTPTPTPPSNPSPSPPPPGVPEPGSLVLFGTGLVAAGAGLRRRYAQIKLARQTQEEE